MSESESVLNFAEKFRKFRALADLTQAQLGEKLGISGNYVYLIEAGKKPSVAVLKLFKILADSPDFLSVHDPLKPPIEPVPVARGYRAPVISWARAGEGTNYNDLCNQIEEYVETDCKDPNCFALIIEGDSMLPEYMAGDVVIFAPNSEPRNGDLVVARLAETGGVLFKKFKRIGPEGQVIRLESLNNDYKSLEYPREAFRFIYPAVQMKRRIRKN